MFDINSERGELDKITKRVIGYGIEVHKGIGPGLDIV